MRCQNCPDKEAVVHINGTQLTHPFSGGEPQTQAFTFHFCETCAKEYERKLLSHSLFPKEGEKQLAERVRVMSVTPARTTIRLIRTETDAAPEEWSLLTSRFPGAAVGAVMTIFFTPSELEWMRGNRELR